MRSRSSLAGQQIMTAGLAGGLHRAYKAPKPATLMLLKHRPSHHFLRHHKSDTVPIPLFSSIFLLLHHPGFFLCQHLQRKRSSFDKAKTRLCKAQKRVLPVDKVDRLAKDEFSSFANCRKIRARPCRTRIFLYRKRFSICLWIKNGGNRDFVQLILS